MRLALLFVLTLAAPVLAQLPAGHPPLAPSASASASAMPPGHPPMPQTQQQEDGFYHPPPDENEEDTKLPEGTIVVELRDPEDKPLPSSPLTLGVLQQAIAKGENRKHIAAQTDAQGIARFDHQEVGSNVAYRVTVTRDGGTFAARPFQLPLGRGMHVYLHVFPVTHDIKDALIIFQGVVYAELRDDRLQVSQALRVTNASDVAYVPDDLTLSLPEGFTALNSQQQMSDVGVDPVPGVGARVKGTFAPGEHEVLFGWQLPYAGDSSIQLDIGMPPHLAALTVRAEASQQMKLVVDGFPESTTQTGAQGEHLLVTHRQLHQGDPPIRKLRVELRDLPTVGPARTIVTGICLAVIAGAIVLTRRRPSTLPADAKDRRRHLLAELEALERARRADDIGPKTYERARRELLNRLARSLAP